MAEDTKVMNSAEEEKARSSLFGNRKPAAKKEDAPSKTPNEPPPRTTGQAQTTGPARPALKKGPEDETTRSRRELLATKEGKPSNTPALDYKASFSLDDLQFDDLDITNQTDDIDFEETNNIDEEMKLLKKNPELFTIFQEGKDLKEYTAKVGSDLETVQRELIGDYVGAGDELASLYTQINACDAVLEQLESLLSNYQTGIRNIGTEIKTLQDQCLSRQVKVNNRKAAHDKIGQLRYDFSIPADLKETLTHGEVNESYLRFLLAFNNKMTLVESSKTLPGQPNVPVMAYQEVHDSLEKLKDKAVGKVKHFLLQNISACKDQGWLRKTHKELINYAYLYQFLFKHAPDSAVEVRESYRETTVRLYYNYFRALIATVNRITEDISTKNDLIGFEEVKQRTIGQLFQIGTPRPQKSKSSVFALGKRQKIIEQFDSPPVSLDSTQKHPYAYLFRSNVYVLMETVTAEMKFTQDFFLSDDATDDILERAVQLFLENLEQFLVNTYDAISVLVMLVIVQKSKATMNQRLVTSLDPFFESAHASLYRRFNEIFALNVQSLKMADAKQLSSADVQPHFITRRYAEFTGGALTLMNTSEQLGDTKFVAALNEQLSKLRDEMQKLLVRLADAKLKDWRSKAVFTINNYDLMLTVLQEHGIHSEDSEQFQKLLDIKTNDLVNDELTRSFGKLMSFAKTHAGLVSNEPPRTPTLGGNLESSLDLPADAATTPNGDATPAVSTFVPGHHRQPSSTDEKVNIKDSEVEALMSEFHAQWKPELEKIQSRILHDFSNFKYGMHLFQKIADDLLVSYSVFVKIVRRYFKKLRISKNFVAEAEVQHEISRRTLRL
eukprot:TRINITY_DN22605_c0_g1_i1.p1 TRINITY_DN22605_c0_g1~~TRINITY_DN22605_c0_g1_i1.p1  ORF type:complete len:838 (+),score=280.12 TRINITY_DN22605_c0_g1_i1:88-2601(+)